jgi:predicted metal-dependent HD superfamily phosphohydrolase
MKYSPISKEKFTEIINELRRYYDKPERHYHNWKHIVSMWRFLRTEMANMSVFDRQHLQLAILFHDAVYDPTRTDNELRSAVLVDYVLHDLLQVNVQYVKKLIMSTIDHQLNIFEYPHQRVAKLFLDADLSILASDEATYDRYTQDLKKEYSHLCEVDYECGRFQFIQAILRREKIFLARRDLEERARSNLNRELSWMRGGCNYDRG